MSQHSKTRKNNTKNFRERIANLKYFAVKYLLFEKTNEFYFKTLIKARHFAKLDFNCNMLFQL